MECQVSYGAQTVVGNGLSQVDEKMVGRFHVKEDRNCVLGLKRTTDHN